MKVVLQKNNEVGIVNNEIRILSEDKMKFNRRNRLKGDQNMRTFIFIKNK